MTGYIQREDSLVPTPRGTPPAPPASWLGLKSGLSLCLEAGQGFHQSPPGRERGGEGGTPVPEFGGPTRQGVLGQPLTGGPRRPSPPGIPLTPASPWGVKRWEMGVHTQGALGLHPHTQEAPPPALVWDAAARLAVGMVGMLGWGPRGCQYSRGVQGGLCPAKPSTGQSSLGTGRVCPSPPPKSVGGGGGHSGGASSFRSPREPLQVPGAPPPHPQPVLQLLKLPPGHCTHPQPGRPWGAQTSLQKESRCQGWAGPRHGSPPPIPQLLRGGLRPVLRQHGGISRRSLGTDLGGRVRPTVSVTAAVLGATRPPAPRTQGGPSSPWT